MGATRKIKRSNSMKQIMRLSDRILKLDTNFTARISTHPSDEPLTEVSFTEEPSYTTSDKLEYEIKTMFPGKNELYLFFYVLMLNLDYISDTIYYKAKYLELAEQKITVGELIHLRNKNTTATLGVVVDYDLDLTRFKYQNKDRINFYKNTIIPNLKKYNLLYIRASDDKTDYSNISDLKIETRHSLETKTYTSLKPNSYDYISFPLIIPATFSYSNYSSMKCRGRDSASIQWNSFYILTALYCLKKGGDLDIILYGDQSFIICQFISFVSNLFSELVITNNILYGANIITNNIKIFFKGYKGVTSDQKEILSNWYTSRKSDTYYTDLGVPCNSDIQNKLHQYSTIHEKHIKLLRTIADKYRHILDTSSPSEQDSIIDYIIKQRHINYFIQVDHFLR